MARLLVTRRTSASVPTPSRYVAARPAARWASAREVGGLDHRLRGGRGRRRRGGRRRGGGRRGRRRHGEVHVVVLEDLAVLRRGHRLLLEPADGRDVPDAVEGRVGRDGELGGPVA